MVLQTAVAGGCEAIVSYNRKDFLGVERFNLKLYEPREFLKIIGALP